MCNRLTLLASQVVVVQTGATTSLTSLFKWGSLVQPSPRLSMIPADVWRLPSRGFAVRAIAATILIIISLDMARCRCQRQFQITVHTIYHSPQASSDGDGKNREAQLNAIRKNRDKLNTSFSPPPPGAGLRGVRQGFWGTFRQYRRSPQCMALGVSFAGIESTRASGIARILPLRTYVPDVGGLHRQRCRQEAKWDQQEMPRLLVSSPLRSRSRIRIPGQSHWQ